MNKTTLLSIGLLIAFFLPWIDLNLITISGYEIPTSLDKLSNLNNLLNEGNNSSSTKYSYILYLIPLLSIINIYKELTNNKRAFINEFQFGIIATIYLFFAVKGYDKDYTSLFSLGYYLTVLFSCIGFLICLFQNKLDYSKKELLEENKSLSSSDKSDLLKQLEQLHSLKEKEILTAEIYEQERNEILKKIENNKTIVDNTINEEIEEESENPIYEQFQNNKALILSFCGVLVLIFGSYKYLNSNQTYQQKITGVWRLPDNTLVEFKQDSILIPQNENGENDGNGKYSISEKDNELILKIPSGNGYTIDNYYLNIIKFDEKEIILKTNRDNSKEVIWKKE